MIKLENLFAEARTIVDRAVGELVPSADAEPRRLHAAARWSLFAGGKRFRPALVLAVGKAFGASSESLVKISAAVEMIHTYSLIHDDLPAMDDDDLRRGRATCHRKFDEATAILAGDVLQTLAFQAIAEDENLSAETRVKLIGELARAAGTPLGMVAGQQLDLEAEGKTISIENLEKIHHRKTGAMIAVSARAGAIVAHASANELRAITDYAARLGLLFQITDDLLDVTQTTEILGKTAGKDVSAEKATYPALYGVEQARRLAENVHAEACGFLREIDKPTEILREIVDYILHRES